MKILKSLAFYDQRGELGKIDTIEHEGALWLVPSWIEFPDEGIRKPTRIVRLDRLVHQVAKFEDTDYFVNEPLPTSLLGTAKPDNIPARFVVVEAPDKVAPIPKRSA